MKTIRHILVCSLLAGVSHFSFSQSCSAVSFKKLFYENDSTMFADNTLTYLNTTTDSSYLLGGSQVVRTDLTGTINWTGGANYAGTDAIPYFSPDGRYFVLQGNFKFINIDASQNVLWQKYLVDTTCYCMHPKHITQTSDGGFIITGYKSVNDTTFYRNRIFVVKTNSTGDTLWTKTIAKTTYDNDGYYAQETTDGGFLVLANVTYDVNSLPDYKIGIIKLNSAGQEQWYKTSSHSIYYMAPIAGLKTADSTCTIVSSTDSITTGTYFLKIKENGNIVFDTIYMSKKFNGGILQQTNGNYLIGMQDSLSTIDGNNRSILYSIVYKGAAEENIPIVAIQPTCDNGYILAGNSAQFAYDCAMCGSHYSYFHFYSYLIKTDSTLQDVQLPSAINELTMENGELIIYPNPSSGNFIIESRGKNQESRIRIYNVLGEVVFQTTNNKQQTTIDLTDEAKGIYFVQITTTDHKIINKKIVVQ